MALVVSTRQQVTRSLQLFKQQGFDVDPHNSDQIAAFLDLKQFCARVTPEKFVAHFASQKSSISSSAGARTEYFGVPKVNFPDGLPESIRTAEVDPTTLDFLELIGGGSVDRDLTYIVDCVAPRCQLGKNVCVLFFEAKKQKKVGKKTPPSSTNPPQQEAASVDLVVPQRTPLGRASLKRIFSDPDGQDAEEPEQKRTRVLTDTLRKLRDDLQQAMNRGQWCQKGNGLQTDSVKYLLRELTDAMQDMAQNPPPSSAGLRTNALVVNIAYWIAHEFLSRAVFRHLHHFKGDFDKILALRSDKSEAQCDAREVVKLIESLASVDADADVMPDLSVASVAVRTKFRGSTLYKSFVECKVDRTLARAKLVSGEQRMVLVQSCQNLPSLPTGVKDTIEVVSTLFDDGLTMVARMQYLAECSMDGCLALAKDWDPNGSVGVASLCMSEMGDLTNTPISLFFEVAGVLNQVERFEAKHPIIQAAITCLKQLKSIATPTPSGPWLDRLAASAIVCRLKLNTDSMHDLVSFKYDEVPSEHQASCFKIVKDYLKLAPEDVPSWWRDWSDEVKRQKDAKRKAEDKGKGNEDKDKGNADKEKGKEEEVDGTEANVNGNEEAPLVADETAGNAKKPALFKVGDVVVGVATKKKSSYDQQDAKVVAVLSKHYKVKMLTGDDVGGEHRYLHAAVKAKVEPAIKPSTTDDGATIAAAAAGVSGDTPMGTDGTDGMQQMEDLFD